MATMAKTDNIGQASSFLDLLTKYQGSSTTTTTQSNISQEGINAMIADILGGNQGLASIAGGQKAAGGYNSSTNQLLINDLLARTTAQVAKATAGTTETKSTAGAKGKTTASVLAAIAAAALGGGKNKDEFGKGTQTYQSYNTSKAEEAAANKTADPIAALNTQKGWTPEDSDTKGTTDSVNMGESTGSGALNDYGQGLVSEGSGMTSEGASLDLGGDEFGNVDFGGGFTGDDFLADGGDLVDSGGASDPGVNLGSGGDFDYGDSGGADLDIDTGGDWVICTELHAQKLLPTKLYLASSLRALELSENVMNGYHYWAVPLTRMVRKYPKLARLIAPIAVARCNHLIGKSSFIGWLTVSLGEPICAGIGKIVAPTNWRELYGNN